MPDGKVLSDKNGVWMVNYLGCAIRSAKEQIEPARVSVEEDRRAKKL
jgi:hypothetical protein